MVFGQKSEVARTIRQIEEEREAAIRGLLGPAVVAQHTFIESRLTKQANRILALIEQHRLSDAMLLMEHEAWGEEDTITPDSQVKEAGDKEETRLDDPGRQVV